MAIIKILGGGWGNVSPIPLPHSITLYAPSWSFYVAQCIRPQTLTCEVPGLNRLAVTFCALGQGTLSSLPSPSEGTSKPLVPWLLAYKQFAFLVAR